VFLSRNSKREECCDKFEERRECFDDSQGVRVVRFAEVLRSESGWMSEDEVDLKQECRDRIPE
jgi:hypothetical protein